MFYPEVGKRNFFFGPQSQFRNMKEALPQSQFRNFLRDVAPQPQLRNSALAIFSEVRNLRSPLPQFLAYFWPWSNLKLDLFYHQVFFCYWEDFKGTVARDIRSLFCSWINPIWTPESYTKRFWIRFQITNPKFRVWIRNPYRVDLWQKLEAKNLVLLSL